MDTPHPLLLIEDDADYARVLARALSRHGYQATHAATGDAALALLEQTGCRLALIDLRLGRENGLELMDRLRKIEPALGVIVMTGHGTVETAVEAMKRGAAHYLQKPFEVEALVAHLNLLTRLNSLDSTARQWQSAAQHEWPAWQLIGDAAPMQAVRAAITRFAPADAPVLVQGESGTGKELAARALHVQSPRSLKPFVVVNCATLKSELLENEMFGHAKGAYTGADRDSEGLFSAAEGGTLFIDEIADMALPVQASLLRVIETGVFRPLGSVKERAVKVRVVAAANRDLAHLVELGKFRQDLYYRLSVLHLQMPPLREHRSDLPYLIEHFAAQRSTTRRLEFTPAARALLEAAPWPGNVRELFNLLERLWLAVPDNRVDEATLQPLLFLPRLNRPAEPPAANGSAAAAATDTAAAAGATTAANGKESELLPLREIEKRAILETLQRCQGNVTKLAQVLQIDRRTLQRKLEQYRGEGDSTS
ncbi:MAG TPA: sigma-54 dependent transcriptional regulator [Planctomycetota bacterium]|nr:sigma-54 dependent transcriptional regulator [Planctomycetota bacterium]